MENNMRKLLFLFIIINSFAFTTAFAEEAAPEEVYIDLKPSVISNLTGGPKYIRFDAQILTFSEHEEKIKLHIPALRHELFLLLADQDGKMLLTPDGKEAFRKEALTTLKAAMKKKTKKERIEDLYFTSFYVK